MALKAANNPTAARSAAPTEASSVKWDVGSTPLSRANRSFTLIGDTSRMRNNFALKSLVVAGLVGVAVGGSGRYLSSPSTTSEASVTDEVTSEWRPTRNTIRDRPMSAAELDAQQPSDHGSTFRPKPQTVATSTNTSTWSYRNCREARAAGAAPLYRGQPGYGPHMDGDGDGIACEPYRGR